MKAKVTFPHTLIADSDKPFFNVVAVVSDVADAPEVNLESLDFIGLHGQTKDKELFLSISGKEIMAIIDLISAKVVQGDYERA